MLTLSGAVVLAVLSLLRDEAERPGFQDPSASGLVAPRAGRQEAGGPTRLSGEQAASVDRALREEARALSPSPGSSPTESSRIEGGLDVTIRVHDERGQPLENVRVFAETGNPDETRVLKRVDRIGTTDRRGRLVLRLHDGPFRFSANGRGARTDLPSGATEAWIDEQRNEVQIELVRLGGTIRVVCVDDRGLPVPELTVSLAPDRLKQSTGPDGSVSFERLKRGAYVVQAGRLHWRGVELDFGSSAEIRFVCDRPGQLAVRTDPPLSPDQAGFVRVTPINGDRGGARLVRLAEAGQTILEIEPGQYRLAAVLVGATHLFPVGAVQARVLPGLTTPATLALGSHTGTLSGRVLRPDGEPAASAQLVVGVADGRGSKRARSDEQGRFEVSGLPAEPLQIWASEQGIPDTPPDPLLDLAGPMRAVRVQLRARRTVEIVVNLSKPMSAGHRLFLCSGVSARSGIWRESQVSVAPGLEALFTRVAPGQHWIFSAPYIYPGLQPLKTLTVGSRTPAVLRIELDPR